jgi:hypothetical protein
MRGILYLTLSICCLSIAFFACKKENSTIDKRTNGVSYTISGIPDTITISKTDSMIIPYLIYCNQDSANTKQAIRVFLKGMPADIKFTYADSEGVTVLQDTLTIISKKSITGLFPVQLLAVDTLGDTQTHNFVIKIPIPNDCREEVSGCYSVWYKTSSGNVLCKSNNTCIYDYNNGLRISPIFALGDSLYTGGSLSTIYATIDCSNNTINIPQQINSYIFSGSGSYNKDTVFLKYYVNGKFHEAFLLKQ